MPQYSDVNQSGGQTVVLAGTAGKLIDVWGTVWVTTADPLAGSISLAVTATADNGYSFQHDMPNSIVLFDATTAGVGTFNFICNHGGGTSDLEVVLTLGGIAATSQYAYIFETKVTA